MNTAIPDIYGENVQLIEVKELEIAQRVSGGIGWILNLEGGGALPIDLSESLIESITTGMQKISTQPR